MTHMGHMLSMTLYLRRSLILAQLQPFDLVALDIKLQEHRDSRINNVRMHMGWIAQVADSFTKWLIQYVMCCDDCYLIDCCKDKTKEWMN